MKQLITFIICTITIISSYAQTIDGIWYSEDNSRTYKIENENGVYKALIEKTSRKDDYAHAVILEGVTL